MVVSIPQANDLDKVIEVFTYIHMHPGCRLQEVSDYIGFTDRQGRYYFHACEYLGLVNKEHVLTPLGQDIWRNNPHNVVDRVYECIMTDNVMGQVFAHGLVFPKEDLFAYTQEVVSLLCTDLTTSDSTLDRRCKVIVKWVERILNYVKLKNQ